MLTSSVSVGHVAYDSRGSGPAIVLLPSGAHERHDYDELRALLPSRFRSIAVDWPGHGESPAWNQAVGEVQLTRLLEETIESLAPEGAVLAGNSIGGNVAVRLAIRRPDLVRGLALMDAGGFESSQFYSRAFFALMSRPWFLRMIYPAFSKWYMRARTEADRRARAGAIATTRSPAGSKAVTEMWHSFSLPDHDIRAQARQITAPTLIVWGREDPIIPVKTAQVVHRLIPDSKLLLIDSGHSPHTGDPAAVAAELTLLLEAAFPDGDPADPTEQASQSGKGDQR